MHHRGTADSSRYKSKGDNKNTDADGNGKIEAQDVALIIMYYNKQTDTLPVCG